MEFHDVTFKRFHDETPFCTKSLIIQFSPHLVPYHLYKTQLTDLV